MSGSGMQRNKHSFDKLRLMQSGRHFRRRHFKGMLLKENCRHIILIQIPMKFVRRAPVDQYISIGSEE